MMTTQDMYLKYAEQQFKDNDKVQGHIIHLDDKRLVFLGKHEDDQKTWYIGFRNEDGDDTRLKVSPEAMGALFNLYNKPRKTEKTSFPLVIKTLWQVTEKPKDNESKDGGSK